MTSHINSTLASLFFLCANFAAGDQFQWREHTLKANRLAESGNFEAAEKAYQDALSEAGELSLTGSSYAESLNNLASLYYTTGRYTEAEPLFVKALRLLSGSDRQAGLVANNLASLYRAEGRYREAEPLIAEPTLPWPPPPQVNKPANRARSRRQPLQSRRVVSQRGPACGSGAKRAPGARHHRTNRRFRRFSLRRLSRNPGADRPCNRPPGGSRNVS